MPQSNIKAVKEKKENEILFCIKRIYRTSDSCALLLCSSARFVWARVAASNCYHKTILIDKRFDQKDTLLKEDKIEKNVKYMK